MTKEQINEIKEAFLRNYNEELAGCQPYLNVKTKQVYWLHEFAEAMNDSGCCRFEIKYKIDEIKSSKSEYIKIPAFKHSDYHHIHHSFLYSKVLISTGQQDEIISLYRGSISKWVIAVTNEIHSGDEILELWQKFKDNEINNLIEKFLKDNNIMLDKD